ncbi:hypothetical protein BJY52DRAFT_921417 [Lactarius psammicola]|nr:hypothetical protein BJY52DRAFT_921417 [Lactarius psammicola]
MVGDPERKGCERSVEERREENERWSMRRSRGMRGVGLLAISLFPLVRYPCRDVIPVWDYPFQFTDSNTTSTVALCPGDPWSSKLRTKTNPWNPISFGTFTKPTIRSKCQCTLSPPLDTHPEKGFRNITDLINGEFLGGLICHFYIYAKSENQRPRLHSASLSVSTAPFKTNVGIPDSLCNMCLTLNSRSNPPGMMARTPMITKSL